MKQTNILSQFRYEPALDGELQTERFLYSVLQGEFKGLRLVEAFRDNPKGLRYKLCEYLKSALRVGQFFQNQKNYATWLDDVDAANLHFSKAIQNLNVSFSRLPKRSNDELKYSLEYPIRNASYWVNENWSQKEHQSYAWSAAERLNNAYETIAEISELFHKYNTQRRSESVNLGEPGKISFIMVLCESWLCFTGKVPGTHLDEDSAFIKFVNYAWNDLGGKDPENSFVYTAKVAVRRFRKDPKDYPHRRV